MTQFLFSFGLILVLAAPLPASALDPLTLVFPQEVDRTEFTDSWGHARSGHRHQGNDLMAPKMTEVYAAADGVVKWVRDRGTAGRYVVVDHGAGWETWYMHLNDDNLGTDDGAAPIRWGVAVIEGEVVEAGQLIGWVGDSGNAEWGSSHTHFELHQNGRALDPYVFLLAAQERARQAPPPAPRILGRPI